jgi:glycosyltransferase involved in cell wall biosynthesis
MPEVAGDAALLVDPYDPRAIADGIYSVLTDEKLRREMVHKGIARAGQFSWEQSVRRVRQIYGEVAGVDDRVAAAGVQR